MCPPEDNGLTGPFWQKRNEGEWRPRPERLDASFFRGHIFFKICWRNYRHQKTGAAGTDFV